MSLLSRHLLNCRHTRAFLHTLLHSDNTAALHHLTVHNIAYQVGRSPGWGRDAWCPLPLLTLDSCSCS